MARNDAQNARDGLHVMNASHSFGDTQVVAGVSVFVKPGELVCLLGPSGCGKTTLLRLAAGLEALQVGRVTIGEELVADGAIGHHVPPEKRGVGLMFQDFALFPHLSVLDNILFGVEKDGGERQKWALEQLENMGLEGQATAYPHMLSGGQQQRVALLRALAPSPRILLLDEPFSGLDVTRRAQIRQDTFQVLKRSGIATLMVTHDPEEAMFMADRILVMQAGRIIQSGDPVEIYNHPETTYVAELFGPVNRLPGVVENGALSTPLGRLPTQGLPDAAEVQVLIRPEALTLHEPGSGPGHPGITQESPVIQVLSARSLGRSTHLTLGVETAGETYVLHARMPGVFMPETGTRVSASVAPEGVLVFPIHDR